MDPVIIDQDELFDISRKVYAIKQHLKKHFDLDGDNQPWHMFVTAKELLRICNALQSNPIKETRRTSG